MLTAVVSIIMMSKVTMAITIKWWWMMVNDENDFEET